MRRPSRWWLAVSGILASFALGTAVAAVLLQRAASTPIGEGEVFVADASRAGEIVDADDEPETAVRRARNELGIEAVSLVGIEGSTLASTSPTMDGDRITSPLLSFGVSEGRFAAVAGPVAHDVVLDGVTEWGEGSILYQVVSPRDDGTSILLYYDISELLARRARPAGIQSETVQLLGLTAVFAILGTVVFMGHTKASRRYREVVVESELLAAANVDLAEARNRAERALALAEEKIRIRSEFVLMINHELRTRSPLSSPERGWSGMPMSTRTSVAVSSTQ